MCATTGLKKMHDLILKCIPQDATLEDPVEHVLQTLRGIEHGPLFGHLSLGLSAIFSCDWRFYPAIMLRCYLAKRFWCFTQIVFISRFGVPKFRKRPKKNPKHLSKVATI